jgi:hypothetical protein
MIIESADIAFNMMDFVKDPECFEEAYNHPEVDKKIKRRYATLKEFEEILETKMQCLKLQPKQESENGIWCHIVTAFY